MQKSKLLEKIQNLETRVKNQEELVWFLSHYNKDDIHLGCGCIAYIYEKELKVINSKIRFIETITNSKTHAVLKGCSSWSLFDNANYYKLDKKFGTIIDVTDIYQPNKVETAQESKNKKENK